MEEEKACLIRVNESTRSKLRSMLKGNPKRSKGVDTYNDVIIRLIKWWERD